MRIIIIGGPKVGKSTLARQLAQNMSCIVRCTDPVSLGGDADDRLDLPQKERWSAISEDVSYWFDVPGPWIIEGVTAVRALRKWHTRNPEDPPPCEKIIVLTVAKQPRSGRQSGLATGVHTVLTELAAWLHDQIQDGETLFVK